MNVDEMLSVAENAPDSTIGDVAKGLAAEVRRLREVAIALREWIDSVPSDVVLPVMPGINRDWVDSVISGSY